MGKGILVILVCLASVGLWAADPVQVVLARQGEPEFDEARHLLYQVYIEEMGWKFPANDPSGLRIEQGAFGPMLVNDYDAVSVRAVAYVNGKIAGTARAAGMLNGKFESELYFPLTPFMNGMKAGRPDSLVEVNRLAVHPDFRKTLLNYWGQKVTAADAMIDRIRITHPNSNLFGVPSSDYAESFSRRWMNGHAGPEVKYNQDDPNTVRIITDLGDPTRTRGTLFERFRDKPAFCGNEFADYLRAFARTAN